MPPVRPADLTVIGDRLLTQEQARSRMPRRPRRGPAGRAVGELVLHPLWIAWSDVLADRPPFRTAVRPTVIFVDAVSQYRGLLATVPHTQVVEDGVVHPATVRRERALELVADVQQTQINRSYLLRKPRHEVRRLELLHLPVWRFDPADGTAVGHVNAVSGADETYLAGRWDAPRT
ncbi:hypothetical protein [Serinicoccus sp. LYQ131]|uniref:hypothetical protein n=1 Tax=Serinicoccus sp. LYQ131 TaxID=3378797 RepID=UPI0038528687